MPPDASLSPDGLYHLATSPEWEAHQASGQIAPASLSVEGFVHCSYGRQVPGTLRKHFGDAKDLLALELDATALGGVELVEEDSLGSGQEFPHAYGAIPVAAVRSVTQLCPPNG